MYCIRLAECCSCCEVVAIVLSIHHVVCISSGQTQHLTDLIRTGALTQQHCCVSISLKFKLFFLDYCMFCGEKMPDLYHIHTHTEIINCAVARETS